ncbi:L-2-hydroxyglutarate oxidase [Cryobacterium luteum]|uniref:L-2-hydroxyglutarate oxidase n=1 Tax=Cryobacterium luteum TaxID=1424661 RepID=A0A1H8CF59_9MICO|nr:L-2-hydroxyglutarate oxidase [Cryobacterium luteum]TFB89336.1 L-2-hydroxyglutarate oxidase [Cryobacterium luteum]SEM93074.1 L-2-hydroxyglutarate oxidase [Cryobacterium luteum]
MFNRRVVIVGGGIVGLAVAERLARRGAQITLVEKEARWAAHQTGHNSGVVHAGPYYVPGSMKARMCQAGNRSMLQFAADNGIAHRRTGKLIVAVTESDLPRLHALHERALANGAVARLITAAEALDYEPHVRAVAALRIEGTGIIDYVAVANALARLAQANGAELLLNTRLTDIAVTAQNVTVQHFAGVVRADLLINCAGLHSDRIALLAGLTPTVRIIPFRGEYYELREPRRHLVNGLIYPVPDPALPFLGVHLTRMIDGSVHAGPNAVLALAREGYAWGQMNLRDTRDAVTYRGFLHLARRNVRTGAQEIARSFSKQLFAASLARLVPQITRDDIVRAGAGVRAQAIRPNGSLADDFIIQQAPRQIHVLNAPSPAATSALEIARHIATAAAAELSRLS